jgi:WD40 repeat protein
MGVAAVAVATSSASASLPGDSAVLTASDGTTTGITINYLTPGTSMKVYAPGSTTTFEPVTDVAWSPNGMRALYVTTGQAIHTVRYNSAADSYFLVPAAAAGVTRSHPTWSSDGSMIFWSEQEASGGPWQLEGMLASYGAVPFRVSPNDGQDYTHPDAGPDGQIAVQVNADSSGTPSGTASTEIYDMTAGTFGAAISGAAQASISPDGTKLAFIQSGQVMVSALNGSGAASISTDTTDQTVNSPANPVWSPDGKQVAFNNGGGTAVVTTSAGGAMPIAVVAGLAGAPAYEAENKDQPLRGVLGEHRLVGRRGRQCRRAEPAGRLCRRARR